MYYAAFSSPLKYWTFHGGRTKRNLSLHLLHLLISSGKDGKVSTVSMCSLHKQFHFAVNPEVTNRPSNDPVKTEWLRCAR